MLGGLGEIFAVGNLRIRIGFDNVTGYALADSLNQLQQLSQFSVCDLRTTLQDGDAPKILDVRTLAEWDAEHLEGAMHVPLPAVPGKIQELPKDEPLAVICGSGYRSSIAASFLQSRGFRRVQNVMGGMGAYGETRCADWQPADLVFIGENI